MVIIDLNDDGAAETKRLVEEAGGEGITFHMHSSSPDDKAAAVALAVDTWGKLNVVCNNAGIGTAPGRWASSTSTSGARSSTST